MRHERETTKLLLNPIRSLTSTYEIRSYGVPKVAGSFENTPTTSATISTTTPSPLTKQVIVQSTEKMEMLAKIFSVNFTLNPPELEPQTVHEVPNRLGDIKFQAKRVRNLQHKQMIWAAGSSKNVLLSSPTLSSSPIALKSSLMSGKCPISAY